jgi:hypothetical protein
LWWPSHGREQRRWCVDRLRRLTLNNIRFWGELISVSIIRAWAHLISLEGLINVTDGYQKWGEFRSDSRFTIIARYATQHADATSRFKTNWKRFDCVSQVLSITRWNISRHSIRKEKELPALILWFPATDWPFGSFKSTHTNPSFLNVNTFQTLERTAQSLLSMWIALLQWVHEQTMEFLRRPFNLVICQTVSKFPFNLEGSNTLSVKRSRGEPN